MKTKTLLKFIPATLACCLVLSPQTLKAQPQIEIPAPLPDSSIPGESAYAQYMRLGYAASQRGDFKVAASYFRSALYERPQDREATIAYWNAKDALQETPNEGETAYDRYMEIAYDATEQEDYQTALINFQRALEERPGDYYATQAIRNVKTYIERGQDPSSPGGVVSEPTVYPGELPYDRYMRLGYAAEQREDYQAAIRHFRSALYERPKDRQATTAYWNAKDAFKNKGSNSTEVESDYDRYMRIGYDATERGNYQTALINFRRALEVRPGDTYAAQAIRNVTTYINRGDN
ncbi:MAG: tetratricopeptide repeat protein [Spirulinaceae cyanobacterium]